MRPKFNKQPQFDYEPAATLKATRERRARYEKISQVLDAHPELVDLIHGDVAEPDHTEQAPDESSPVRFKCSTESILRIMICMIIECRSLRDLVTTIDENAFLRRFVRVYNEDMVDFTTFCRIKNRVKPETWAEVNKRLTQWAAEKKKIGGKKLRMDTTAVETNIHYPTDSSLLLDTYRTLSRLIKKIRKLDQHVVGDKRLLNRKVKRLVIKIARKAASKKDNAEAIESLYFQLIQLVQNVLGWCEDIASKLEARIAREHYSIDTAALKSLREQMMHYQELGQRVARQAWARVIEKKPLSNEEKIFSIFEPHTELLKRGKAGKDIEFGHMVQIEQVDSKFVTHYEVFPKKPVEHELIENAIEHHRQVFGTYPEQVSADKGYYDSMEQISALSKKITMVAIGKKGKRSEHERERESSRSYRLAQGFRAGIEGTISYLKRSLGLARCYTKTWAHYAATVGATILVHNLIILARC